MDGWMFWMDGWMDVLDGWMDGWMICFLECNSAGHLV